jgi:hypothetical protein
MLVSLHAASHSIQGRLPMHSMQNNIARCHDAPAMRAEAVGGPLQRPRPDLRPSPAHKRPSQSTSSLSSICADLRSMDLQACFQCMRSQCAHFSTTPLAHNRAHPPPLATTRRGARARAHLRRPPNVGGAPADEDRELAQLRADAHGHLHAAPPPGGAGARAAGQAIIKRGLCATPAQFTRSILIAGLADSAVKAKAPGAAYVITSTCAHTSMYGLPCWIEAQAARTAGLPPPAAAAAASSAGAPSLGAPWLLPASKSNAAASRDCMSGSRPATASVCCCECCSWRHQSFACVPERE